MPETKHPLKVFLCHAHSDAAAVRALYLRLRREGVDVWLDKEKLLPGSDWELEIRKAVRESDVVVVCLSRQFNQAGFRQKEVRIALDTAMEQPEGEIFIIPARLEECENLESLSKWHWVDLFEDDGFQRLMRALRARADRIGATLRIRRGGQATTHHPKNHEPDTKVDAEQDAVEKARLEAQALAKLKAAHENEEDKKAEKAAQEELQLEAAERASREKAELEKAAQERAEREAIEKAAREKAEREKLEREAAEKARKEKAELEAAEKGEREKAEKAAQEKLEHEATEKARTEEAELKAAEKAFQEKAKRDAAEKSRRERAERRSVQITVLKETLSKFFSTFKVAVRQAKPFLRIGGIIGFILVLFWVGSWAMPQILSLVPTARASVTLRPVATLTSLVSFVPFTKTVEPNVTPTKTNTPSPPETFIPVTPLLGIGSTIIGKDGMTLLYVPAGDFTMGSDEGYPDTKPVHTVNLDAFWIDQTEVTIRMYYLCVQAGMCKEPTSKASYTNSNYFGNSEFNDYPVIYVEWDMAKTYCAWVDRRLPTEAEWEKAARGTDGRRYPWGEDHASFDCNRANILGCFGDTNKVGSYEAGKSPYEVYDMAGNVWEWVADWYRDAYYVSSPKSNPSGPESGNYRVIRGGSWNYVYYNFGESADRDKHVPTNSYFNVGFRCARDAIP